MEERVSAFPTGQVARLAGPHPAVVGIVNTHEQVVLATIRRHTAAGRPFDVGHTHVEARRTGRAHGLGDAGPPVLATQH